MTLPDNTMIYIHTMSFVYVLFSVTLILSYICRLTQKETEEIIYNYIDHYEIHALGLNSRAYPFSVRTRHFSTISLSLSIRMFNYENRVLKN